MEKTIISFDDFQESLKNNTLTELFDNEFNVAVVFKHRKDLDKRSGYFDFMRNYILKHVSHKINLKGDDIATELFTIENNQFYYKNRLILSCQREETDVDITYYYFYNKLKN